MQNQKLRQFQGYKERPYVQVCMHQRLGHNESFSLNGSKSKNCPIFFKFTEVCTSICANLIKLRPKKPQLIVHVQSISYKRLNLRLTEFFFVLNFSKKIRQFYHSFGSFNRKLHFNHCKFMDKFELVPVSKIQNS